MLKMCTVKLAYKGGKISQSRKYPLMNNYFCSSSNSSSFCFSLCLFLSFFFLSVFQSLCLFIFSVCPFRHFWMCDSLMFHGCFASLSLSLFVSVCLFLVSVWFFSVVLFECLIFHFVLIILLLFFLLSIQNNSVFLFVSFCMSVVLFFIWESGDIYISREKTSKVLSKLNEEVYLPNIIRITWSHFN